ncbi:UDP-N-acetylmuramoyl-tripeptide--D-alanyl-D-alanine ligase [uncultured Bacteroides sp.]|uniref:UDP-N-acetylmuramoyl-tripeptide--D-alanyl-D- alanine ligase n=1 Tax=uncultured Bacteroides sp. TaxID=162156 RepID=UPI002AAAD681|nr:UDP-N-acetylmuramoyl-tripeptide--D-alanyl-D-alanine ligase [uncultured Bacteroides sp.]
MTISALYQIYLQCPIVTTDSRNCPKGSLFIALKGDTFNGNSFAKKALEEGSSYAVVDEAEYADPENNKIILVDDCLKTLQQLANYHRKKLGTKVIGITGTNGKTTTKELIAAILSESNDILYTQGNLNNHIGVPLTLLRLRGHHDLAVIEMGANHPGEIKALVNIAEPDYGIITNVGKAHLEGFGSFEGVIKTKGELYDYLRQKEDSIVFIQNENPFLMDIAKGLTLINYGVTENLYVNGKVTSCSPYLAFDWKAGKDGNIHHVQTKLIGEYNFDNALAAVAIGRFFGIEPAKIDHALTNYSPQNNRSQLKETEDNKLIIDAYNANPTSMMAALRNFKRMEVKHKFAILGDMKELGATSIEEHQKIVDFIDTCDFDRVILIGDQFEQTTHAYDTYANVSEAIKVLDKDKPKGCYILIKGSNSMKLGQMVEHL